MAQPAQRDADLSEGPSAGGGSLPRPAPPRAEVSSAEPHEAEDTHEPATLPGGVATVWTSILSTAYRRLGKGR